MTALAIRSQGLLRSEQRLDRRNSHQILHGIGELPVERDQSVGLELGQSDVLSVKRVRPPELVGDLPCDVLKAARGEFIGLPAVLRGWLDLSEKIIATLLVPVSAFRDASRQAATTPAEPLAAARGYATLSW